MKTITILITLLMCGVAHARLGETVDECLKRYGMPYGMDEKQTTFYFVKDGITIHVTFDGGKCVQITYTSETDWTPKDEDLLRAANGGSDTWRKGSGWLDSEWTSSSGLRFYRKALSRTIAIASKKWHEREMLEARKKAEAEASAKARDKTKGL